MAITTSWLNKILYRKTNDDNTITEIDYKIGTTFDQVKASNTNSYTLANLVNELKTFFNRRAFMHYSIQSPYSYSTTVEWYQIGGDTNDIDSHINKTEL